MKVLMLGLSLIAFNCLAEELSVGFGTHKPPYVFERENKGLEFDIVVAAGSNGDYLRQRLETPVVLVKVGGFDLMRALARAKQVSHRVGLVTYEGMAPDLSRFDRLFDFDVAQRSYRTEDEARACVRELQQAGAGTVPERGEGDRFRRRLIVASLPTSGGRHRL